MKYYSTSHDYSGRKVKKRKPKGEVYGKYTPPKFTEMRSSVISSYASFRLEEQRRYPSRSDFEGIRGQGTKVEPKEYTGDYVIGIATMHKSNAVPVTNSKHATEISRMGK